jgi:hypothetical protein
VFSIPKLVGPCSLALMGALFAGGCAHHAASRGPFTDVTSRDKDQATETAPIPSSEPPLVAELPNKQPASSPSGLPVTPTTTALIPSTQHRVEVAPYTSSRERVAIPIADLGHGVIVREWPVSICWRPSGDTLAGPDYWPSEEVAFKRPEWMNMFMEPLEFFYNTALLPYRAVVTPPWAQVVYSPVNRVGGNP